MQLSEELVRQQLGLVVDPEVGLTITDMGLVYGVQIEEGVVHVTMTLTTRGCPMGPHILTDVERVIAPLEGVKQVQVHLVWDPPWTPEKIKPEAQEALRNPYY